MAFDAHANFGVSSVAVAPSPATTGTSLTVATGEGTRFPAVPFNATLAPSGVLATPANAEIVRVTARSGDVLTITRAQEGSVARAVVVGDLCVASITAKALQDIETTPYARTDAANTFTQNQRLQLAAPQFFSKDTSAPAGTQQFAIVNYAQRFDIRAVNDAGDTVISVPVSCSRGGSIYIGADLYEKQRTTPIGHWIDVPFNAANFVGSGGMTWTVSAGNVIANRYALTGKILVWRCDLGSTSMGGTLSPYLNLTIPGGFTGASRGGSTAVMITDNGVASIGDALAASGGAGTTITVYKVPATNFSASASNTAIRFMLHLEIQ